MSSRSDSTVGQTQDVTMTDSNEDNTTDWSTEDQDQSNDSMTEYEHDSDSSTVVADNDDGDDDDDFSSSDDEEETPRMSLTQNQALEAGVEPTFWYAGDKMPDFQSLGLDESDILRLCREFNINPHTKMVGLKFGTDSPFWELRCAFVRFLRAR